MKTLLRILISLLIVLWLGADMFFPAVAQVAFSVLPSKYEAGLVVRSCLNSLHNEGLVIGSILLILLVFAGIVDAYGQRLVGPVLCTVAMLLLTAFSQWHIIPRMEADRLEAGGDIDKAPTFNQYRIDFNKLHAASVDLESGVIVAGLAMVVFLARPARTRN